jgi:hypothetical protein
VSNHADGQRDFAEESEANQHNDSAEREKQILTNHAPSSLAESKGRKNVFQPIVHQYHIGLFEGSVRTSGSHRNADVRGSQTGRIVHAIANHCNTLSLFCQSANFCHFLLWFQFGPDLVKMELRF